MVLDAQFYDVDPMKWSTKCYCVLKFSELYLTYDKQITLTHSLTIEFVKKNSQIPCHKLTVFNRFLFWNVSSVLYCVIHITIRNTMLLNQCCQCGHSFWFHISSWKKLFLFHWRLIVCVGVAVIVSNYNRSMLKHIQHPYVYTYKSLRTSTHTLRDRKKWRKNK